jgi:hypothetical protein
MLQHNNHSSVLDKEWVASATVTVMWPTPGQNQTISGVLALRDTKRSGAQNAHNHPSGIAEPSQADELITLRIKEALALVDIRLLDHIIVGDGVCVSLAELGAHAAVLGRSIRVSLTRWRS